ncbi:MAG: aldehyde dehydrogenase family protein [Phototrophicaceae bacterium]
MISFVEAQYLPPSTPHELDQAVETLQARKATWVTLTLAERIALLESFRERLIAVAPRWIDFSKQAKGTLHLNDGEDAAILGIMFRHLSALQRTLTHLHTAHPPTPSHFDQRENGQVVADVFPNTLADRIIYFGVKAEVWFEPSATLEQIRAEQARHYKHPDQAGKVVLVLGAGNIGGLLSGDFLHKLYGENKVVILKLNPINQYLGVLLAEVFAPLIERGFLQLAYGGVEQAQYLIQHEGIDELHMTGSDKTYDAIVFGTGENGRANKRDNRRQVTKPFTAELGNVSPIIVVPGEWSDEDVLLHGENIAAQVTTNAGFNCVTPRVVVQHAEWDKRHDLNQAIELTFSQASPRLAYYPDAHQRHQAFLQAHPHAKQFGTDKNGLLPWTFIPDVDPLDTENIAFKQEAFCGLVTETALSATDTLDFLEQAVRFVNEVLWGTLTVTLLVHPKTWANPTLRQGIEQGIAQLRYGMVTVNLYGNTSFVLQEIGWGGYAGATPNDIQSGIGVVHNTLLLEHIEKSVIYAPFDSILNRQTPTNPNFANVSQRLMWFEARPTVWNLARLGWALLKS